MLRTSSNQKIPAADAKRSREQIKNHPSKTEIHRSKSGLRDRWSLVPVTDGHLRQECSQWAHRHDEPKVRAFKKATSRFSIAVVPGDRWSWGQNIHGVTDGHGK